MGFKHTVGHLWGLFNGSNFSGWHKLLKLGFGGLKFTFTYKYLRPSFHDKKKCMCIYAMENLPFYLIFV